jgi:transposase InsO family protein
MYLKGKSGRSQMQLCREFGLTWGRYQSWKKRYRLSSDLEDRTVKFRSRLDAPLPEEIEAVKAYALSRPQDGYRRLTWRMIDEDIAYLSESSVYRILSENDLLHRWNRSRQSGQGPEKATIPNQRWHTDIMYLRIKDSWYFLVSFLDDYSRYLVHWELLTSMTADDVTLAAQAALEKYPCATPEIVSDHGVQYTSAEFKKLIRRFKLKHILCRIAHPQSNGQIERYHRSTREKLETKDINNFSRAREVIGQWVDEYNEHRLHAGLGFLRPADYFRRDPDKLRAIRRQKITEAKERRININISKNLKKVSTF